MKILTIALKLVKQNFIQPVNILIFTAIPVLLILILGTALSGVFSTTNEIPEIHIAYHLEKQGPRGEALVNFLQNSTAESTIPFAHKDEGLRKLEQGAYQAFVVFDESSSRIDLYLNNAGGISSGIIEAMIRSFINETEFHRVLLHIGEKSRISQSDLKKNYILEKGLNRPKQPEAMDNMGILIISMFVLFGAFLVSYSVETEQNNTTLSRIYTAPVSKQDVFMGIFLGNFITMGMTLLFNLLLAKFLLGVYFGEKFFIVVLVLVCEVFLSVSLGVALALSVKDSKVVKGLANVIILSFVFFAGGYGPLPEEPFFQMAKLFSPMTWVKESLFEVIYANTFDKLIPAIAICLGLGLLFIIISFVVSYRREEL